VICARRAALLAILLLAAALRAVGLGWGLRHPPHPDESVFLDNVALMLRSGDLDHRYYQYPGLFFYMLYPLVWLLPSGGDAPGPAAYQAARALVAAFGVAACFAAGGGSGSGAGRGERKSPSFTVTATISRPTEPSWRPVMRSRITSACGPSSTRPA